MEEENKETASIDNKKEKLIRSFESTPPLDLRLRVEAATKKVSVSALIREILERHYEER